MLSDRTQSAAQVDELRAIQVQRRRGLHGARRCVPQYVRSLCSAESRPMKVLVLAVEPTFQRRASANRGDHPREISETSGGIAEFPGRNREPGGEDVHPR